MNAVKGGLDKVLMVATAVLFTVMVVAAVWQVAAREILQNSPAWTSVLAGYAFVWTALIATALVFGERGHFAVTVVVQRFPRVARKIVAVAVQLVILAFAVIVLILGGVYAVQNTWLQTLNALPGTIGMYYLALPISGVFISFYAIHHAIEDLRGQGPLTVEVAETQAEAQAETPETPGLEEVSEGEFRPESGTRRDDTDGGPASVTGPKEK